MYIGSTISFKNRWKCHRSLLRGGVHHSARLQHAWTKHGEENFWLEVLAECDELERADVEQHWMDSYQCYTQGVGYNMNPMAESCAGRKHTEETKAKIAKAHKGKVHSEIHRKRGAESQRGRTVTTETCRKLSIAGKGRIHSPEALEKMKESRKGFAHSDESKRKLSIAATGRVPSQETRLKLSEAGMGRKWTESQRQKISANIRDRLTPEQRATMSRSRGGKPFTITAPDGSTHSFVTLTDAAKMFGLDNSNIHKCLLGKAKTTRGYGCEYDPAPQLACQI